MKWFNIKEKLPEHQETILAYSSKGYCVVVFIDSVKMNAELAKTPYAYEQVNIEKNPFYFASQERRQYTMGGVTHWMRLPDPIEITGDMS